MAGKQAKKFDHAAKDATIQVKVSARGSSADAGKTNRTAYIRASDQENGDILLQVGDDYRYWRGADAARLAKAILEVVTHTAILASPAMHIVLTHNELGTALDFDGQAAALKVVGAEYIVLDMTETELGRYPIAEYKGSLAPRKALVEAEPEVVDAAA